MTKVRSRSYRVYYDASKRGGLFSFPYVVKSIEVGRESEPTYLWAIEGVTATLRGARKLIKKKASVPYGGIIVHEEKA